MFNRFFLLINGITTLLTGFIVFYFSGHILSTILAACLVSIFLAFINLIIQIKGYQELYDEHIEKLKKNFDILEQKFETEHQKNTTNKKKNFLFIDCASCHKTNKVPIPHISALTDLTFECAFCKAKNKVFSYFQTATITEPLEDADIFQKLEKELYQSSVVPEVEITSTNQNSNQSTHENKTEKQ